MYKYTPLILLCSTLLSACVSHPHIDSSALHPQPSIYATTASKEQIQAAIANAIQALDDQHTISPVTRSKLETLFNVDLALANATPINTSQRWQTLSPDGLFSISLTLSTPPNGLSSYAVSWKNQASADYLDSRQNNTPPSTEHCLNPADIRATFESQGWHIKPGPAHQNFPVYVRNGDPTSVQILFAGNIITSGNVTLFGPCINQIMALKPKTT